MSNRRIPDVLSMIRALIAQPSISCTDPRFDQSNLGIIHLLAEWLEELGFRVQIQPLGHGKANLIARLGRFDQPAGLILSGHTDTVPCDPELWSSDPFSAMEKNNRIYGLGSADMKSFFALALEAVQDISAERLHHPLLILATADEESSMSGAKALNADGSIRGHRAIIGEPTGLKPVRMHKGVLLESIIVRGHSGHSSNPSLGANAIEGMSAVLDELLAFSRDLRARYRNPAFEVDYPTLNLGSIHGGDNPNRICGHCETQIDIRPLPGMDLGALHGELANRLRNRLQNHGRLTLEVRRLFDGLPAFETPADGELVRYCEHLTHVPAGAVPFGTEAPFLARLGAQTLVLGPGQIQQAHQPDEYLALDQIEPAIRLYRRLVDRFCLEAACP